MDGGVNSGDTREPRQLASPEQPYIDTHKDSQPLSSKVLTPAKAKRKKKKEEKQNYRYKNAQSLPFLL